MVRRPFYPISRRLQGLSLSLSLSLSLRILCSDHDDCDGLRVMLGLGYVLKNTPSVLPRETSVAISSVCNRGSVALASARRSSAAMRFCHWRGVSRVRRECVRLVSRGSVSLERGGEGGRIMPPICGSGLPPLQWPRKNAHEGGGGKEGQWKRFGLLPRLSDPGGEEKAKDRRERRIIAQLLVLPTIYHVSNRVQVYQ
ncbi:hypothetical protein LY78DRAFT_264664 [Colletotrichum sublineola]|nr:hypothetical protein LY78DRAFT_264664 [Colletotrichum sublineola]